MWHEALKTKTWKLISGLKWGAERTGGLAAHLAPRRAGQTRRTDASYPNLRPALLALGLGFALAGCTVGPQYKGAPQTHLAEFHNATSVGARQTDSPPPPVETWWTGFRDPVLTRIVDRALAQNLDLAAAIARVDQARAAAREAGAQLLPNATAIGSASPLRQSLNSPV